MVTAAGMPGETDTTLRVVSLLPSLTEIICAVSTAVFDVNVVYFAGMNFADMYCSALRVDPHTHSQWSEELTTVQYTDTTTVPSATSTPTIC